MTNNGAVTGGAGGTGGYNNQRGGAGGTGGTGISLTASVTATNSGNTTGGAGGAGRLADGNLSVGGTGISLAASTTATNSGTITGGAGGAGGTGANSFAYGGYGGTGGTGVYVDGNPFTNTHIVTGGAGGAGGYAGWEGGVGGNGGAGISIAASATATNSGTITVDAAGAGANARSIAGNGGTGGAGVLLDGGTLTDSGTITGGAGGAAGTGPNLGTAGAEGDAVKFGSLASTLIIDPGAVFNGHVAANSSVADVLELAGTTAGSFSGLSSQFTGFSIIDVNAGASWTLTGTDTVSGAFNVSGALAVDGTLDFTGDLTMFSTGAISGPGTVAFGTSAAMIIDGTTMPTVTIRDFAAGDSIELANVDYSSGGEANFDYSTDVLTVVENGDSYNLQFSGNFTGEYFHLTDPPLATTITVDGTPCYCRGTLILTDRGEIAVENLAIGDRLITKSGEARPLRWIGRRSYSGRFTRGNRDVLPVRIARGALAENVPSRELWVSPLHAMYIDGVLIPAHALVNGGSITQAVVIELVEYFHLELETHDVILAEGAWSESFIDDDSRGMFHNAAEYCRLYPDEVRGAARFCAPRVEDGTELEIVRRKIAAWGRDSQRISLAG